MGKFQIKVRDHTLKPNCWILFHYYTKFCIIKLQCRNINKYIRQFFLWLWRTRILQKLVDWSDKLQQRKEVTGYVNTLTASSPTRFGSGGKGQGIPRSDDNPNHYFQPVVSLFSSINKQTNTGVIRTKTKQSLPQKYQNCLSKLRSCFKNAIF